VLQHCPSPVYLERLYAPQESSSLPWRCS
jgi:hypothetical protein